MCPGGQIVPAGTSPDEAVVNGMSFSKRDSEFANSALVVTIDPDDALLEPYREKHGVLAGLRFQEDMERRAAEFGGGNFTVPVQTLTDFVAGATPSSDSPLPPTSYRLGVKHAPLHKLYPPPVVAALTAAVADFDRKMPGYLSSDALLHGVETRTSSPLRVERNRTTHEASVPGLFVCGEGAGFAGGIVSAAADGCGCAVAIARQLGGEEAAMYLTGLIGLGEDVEFKGVEGGY
jgi:uncharacterized FAD-dependent dehydrogenase